MVNGTLTDRRELNSRRAGTEVNHAISTIKMGGVKPGVNDDTGGAMASAIRFLRAITEI
jgi:hypothetical protein